MRLRLLTLPFALLPAACATDDAQTGDDVIVERTALDRCADDGVVLTEVWNVDNLHGPIVRMALAQDGTVVVSTEDGSVKQWSIGTSADAAPLPGGRPSYGTPLEQEGAQVGALAVADARLLAGDADGTFRQFTLADSELMSSQALGVPLTAVAALDDGAALVADDGFTGNMRVVSAAGDAGDPFETTLWGVTTFLRADDVVFTGGHDYGIAAIERRTVAAPEVAADVWDPEGFPGSGGTFVQGWVSSLGLSADGSVLVVGVGVDSAGGGGSVLIMDPADLLAGPLAELATVPVRAVAVSDTGGLVAVATDGRVALHTSDLATEVGGVDVVDPRALVVDPSGERLIVASGDGHLRAYVCQ